MEPEVPERRPSVRSVASETDLLRWYWLREELVQIARLHGIPTGGGKVELTRRIADSFAGREPRPPARHVTSPQLQGPLDGDTVIPPGQRCSQVLREWFTGRIGPGFRFDAAMRELVAAGDVTLDEAVGHWWATRDADPAVIAPQFEYNRFTRAWRAAHPEGQRHELLAAWWAHRSAPRDV